ncbi:MAG: hypothetical protein AABW67_00905 [Nanoarchaeota archaeon]
MEINVAYIYKIEKENKKLIHSEGLTIADWNEKERLEKIFDEIPIIRQIGIISSDSSYKAKIFLKEKYIEIYPLESRLEGFFNVQDAGKLKNLSTNRQAINFDFKENTFYFSYLSEYYRKKLEDFYKAVQEFRGD